jgi:hypothetical protein
VGGLTPARAVKNAWLAFLLAIWSGPTFAQISDEIAGDRFRITLFHETAAKGEDGSSSSSRGGHEYLEEIAAVRADGVERIYDVPLEPDSEERLITWQFPVHVLETNDGGIEVLNRDELERRRDAWLEAAEIAEEACGTWYFTWNAFQVECDPDAIVETIRAIKIQPDDMMVGASFKHPAAHEPGELTGGDEEGVGVLRSAHMLLDPDYIHRAKAESDVIVGQLMQEPISFEEAYSKRKAERITGTIDVSLEADPEGRVWKRTTAITSETTEVDGNVERSVSTETVERRRLE